MRESYPTILIQGSSEDPQHSPTVLQNSPATLRLTAMVSMLWGGGRQYYFAIIVVLRPHESETVAFPLFTQPADWVLCWGWGVRRTDETFTFAASSMPGGLAWLR